MPTSPQPPTPSRPARPWTSGPYTLRHVLIAYAVVLVPLALLFPFVIPKDMSGEGGIIETLEVIALAISAAAGLLLAWSRPAFRDKCNVLWLGAAAALMGLREYDLHEHLNDAAHLGSWAIHFRLDWFTGADVPWYVKVVWILAFGVALGSVAIPLLLARPNGLAQLRRRDLGGWLFVLAIFFIASGWAWDDLLGRDQFLPSRVTKTIEELSEMAGYIAYFLSTWIAIKVPLADRE